MFLTHGLNRHDEMIPVEAVASGRTALSCPYCGRGLIARKGKILAWHFAHDGETCRDVAGDNDRIEVPYCDRFDLGLSGKMFDELAALRETKNGRDHRLLELLKHRGFIQQAYNPNPARYIYNFELTHRGKIPFGETTLFMFAPIQRDLIASHHQQLVDAVATGLRHGYEDVKTAVTDLRLYRAQLRRLLSASLYLLEVQASDGRTLYKIGITGRDVADRAGEVQQTLRPFLGDDVRVRPLRVAMGRGAIERYALHRWRDQQQQIGRMTEFIQLDDRRTILSEFTRLADLDPDELERAIIAGEPAPIEKEWRDQQRRSAIIAGMQQAAADGVHIGRPADDAAAILDKYPDVVTAVNAGLSLRKAAKRAGVAVNTVRKVKAALAELAGHQRETGDAPF